MTATEHKLIIKPKYIVTDNYIGVFFLNEVSPFQEKLAFSRFDFDDGTGDRFTPAQYDTVVKIGYLFTWVLTEMVSNNAVAVVITPLAISIAAQLGMDPRPLVVAVMVAASASFATPIGYQTNMLVYGPGGYKFTDFLKVGIPLNLSIGVLASLCIPWFWPLYPAG